jgi:hypothetical protein
MRSVSWRVSGRSRTLPASPERQGRTLIRRADAWPTFVGNVLSWTKLRQISVSRQLEGGRSARCRRSAWRRVRHSNSRGLAPNTLSNNADQRSPASATIRGLHSPVPADRGGEPSSACKFVIVGVANHAGPDGTGAFPSVATLIRYTGLSERTVCTCLGPTGGRWHLTVRSRHRRGPAQAARPPPAGLGFESEPGPRRPDRRASSAQVYHTSRTRRRWSRRSSITRRRQLWAARSDAAVAGQPRELAGLAGLPGQAPGRAWVPGATPIGLLAACRAGCCSPRCSAAPKPLTAAQDAMLALTVHERPPEPGNPGAPPGPNPAEDRRGLRRSGSPVPSRPACLRRGGG